MNIDRKKFYQNARKPANYVPNVLVSTAPTFPPTMSGLMQIDPVTKDIWLSAGNVLVTDWRNISNPGGGGTAITLQTNGDNNADQTLLNLRANGGSGITLTDTGGGTVLFETDASSVKKIRGLSANVNISLLNLTSFTPVSELFINVTAGTTYTFRFLINYAVTGTGNGVAFSINGVATSFLNYYMLSNPTTTGPAAFVQTLYLTTYNSPPIGTYGSNFSATANFTIIEGNVTPSVSGSISLTITSDGQAGTCTINPGSHVEYSAFS
jgi:hypothetical protein